MKKIKDETMITEYNEFLNKSHTVKFKNSLYAQGCEDWVIIDIK